MPNLRNGSKGDSNQLPLYCESSILLLSYRTPHRNYDNTPDHVNVKDQQAGVITVWWLSLCMSLDNITGHIRSWLEGCCVLRLVIHITFFVNDDTRYHEFVPNRYNI